jgi:uncharacterized membrane protein YeaQ/YmgE (transglycosylase-associated protein family)
MSPPARRRAPGSAVLLSVLLLLAPACARSVPLPAPPGPTRAAERPSEGAPAEGAVGGLAQATVERDDAWCAIRPILGGLAGAVIGYVLLEDGEMGGLIGPLAGAVVGAAVFRCWKERELLPPPPRRSPP